MTFSQNVLTSCLRLSNSYWLCKSVNTSQLNSFINKGVGNFLKQPDTVFSKCYSNRVKQRVCWGLFPAVDWYTFGSQVQVCQAFSHQFRVGSGLFTGFDHYNKNIEYTEYRLPHGLKWLVFSRFLTLAFSVGSMTMPLVELLSSRETTHRNSAWSSLP